MDDAMTSGDKEAEGEEEEEEEEEEDEGTRVGIQLSGVYVVVMHGIA